MVLIIDHNYSLMIHHNSLKADAEVAACTTANAEDEDGANEI